MLSETIQQRLAERFAAPPRASVPTRHLENCRQPLFAVGFLHDPLGDFSSMEWFTRLLQNLQRSGLNFQLSRPPTPTISISFP